jgi:AcrR family transcriptional regulator
MTENTVLVKGISGYTDAMPAPAQRPAPSVSAGRSARARVREEMAKEILEAARARMASGGPAALSLRAVARDLGMVPSALYRYYASRDALLTALIIEGYRGLGEAALAADASVAPADFAARWFATTGAFRAWALAHPQEWALIYGSPVPGYQAPPETVAVAFTVTSAVGRILGDAYRAGRLHPPEGLGVPSDLAADLERIGELVGETPGAPSAPPAVVAVAVVALGHILGAISAELFGQYDNAIEARDSMWQVAMTVVGRVAGLDLASRP